MPDDLEIALFGGAPPDWHPPWKLVQNKSMTNPNFPGLEIIFGECDQGHGVILVTGYPTDEQMAEIERTFKSAEHVMKAVGLQGNIEN